jgi:uncharacterized protein (DUF362 family)
MSNAGFSRRSFIGGAMGLCAAAQLRPGLLSFQAEAKEEKGLAPIRKRLPNPYTENGKPVVVMVHGTDFKSMLAKGMELLGGFALFGRDKAIHINPNFVAPTRYPNTTDGESLVSTVELLQGEGFGDITIAEWGSSGNNYEVEPTRAFQVYGLDKKAETGGFKIKDLAGEEAVATHDGRWTAMPFVNVFKSVYEVPLVIDMPTVKQHSQVLFTCALKNTMGQVDTETRLVMHRDMPEFKGMDPYEKLEIAHLAVAEIAHAVNPDLTIIDARKIMGRTHHVSAGGILFDANCVIISGDPLAADRVAAGLLERYYKGFKVAMAERHLKHAAHIGLGVADLEGMVVKEADA